MPYDSELGSFGELGPYPTLDLMSNYDVVIWTQGDHNQRNITSWEECISDYLDNGGNMWIMGQQFLSALNGSDGPRESGDFEYDYFMVEYVRNSAGTPDRLIGVEDDEIFGDAEYDMGDNSIYYSDYADWIMQDAPQEITKQSKEDIIIKTYFDPKIQKTVDDTILLSLIHI